MKLFDLSLRLNGFPLGKAIKHLKGVQSYDQPAFETHLKKQREAIVEYHTKHNTFYKTLAPHIDPGDWNTVPVITKRQLQKPLAERLSEGHSLKSVYVNKTSGSTGDPFVFAKDKFCHALTWAVIQDRFSWYGLDFNRSRQARFYGIPLDSKGYYKERFKDYLSNRWRFSVFDLSDAAFENHLAVFKRKTFDYINGYTSSVVQFAKFLDRRNLVLKTVCPSLRYCMVTSEMLSDSDRELMTSRFGVPVINEYGAAELDLIAFEQPDGRWRINSESLFVEILDDKDQPVPLGQEGRIIVTSLYNKAHPFIRYDVGDIGAISKDSDPRDRYLDRLIGRKDDLILLPSGKRAAGLTFYYITKSIIEDDGNVKEFVIRQTALDTFRIVYVSTMPLSADKQAIIKDAVINYLEDGLHIEFDRQEQIHRSKSGKLKQFSSQLNAIP